jgi:hypothetical protein
MVEEVNLCMMYLIHFNNPCKYHNVLPPITIIKEKTKQNKIIKLLHSIVFTTNISHAILPSVSLKKVIL